ncbi:hypothetical protein NHH03_06255 [Stieleria sp. TO1_6]|uniref:hypothetical protein n=1 Tax=Stieleria tagensis TaxID=2956795 RepID=UPI00209B36C6|nr:hypothetical protein [Stieleria tagensis]MCO8121332.1 hypothetical protein [Stieleria tagensis]
MTRNPTFSEIVWPNDPDSHELAIQWAGEITVQALNWIWRAFDVLYSDYLSGIDMRQPLEQLERDLVRHHHQQIIVLYARETDGFASFTPHHEWPEMESRSEASAQPPSNDIAFVATSSNQRWALAVEAKVLPTKGELYRYMNDVNDKFVTGIASPFVDVGAMIGYLLCDDAETVFAGIEKRLKQKLESPPEFASRAHRTSQHERAHAPDICLHHMIMVCV